MSAGAQLAQCPRCQAYTLVEERRGYHLAVDVAPLDALGYGVAVASGVGLWCFEKPQNGTSGRLSRPPAGLVPQWGAGGSQTGSQPFHAEHSCGASAKDQRVVKAPMPSAGPQQAPVTPGRASGGLHRPGAPGGATGAQERPSRATHVIRPPSRPTRCGICGKMIAAGQSWWGFEHATTVYGEHEECP